MLHLVLVLAGADDELLVGLLRCEHLRRGERGGSGGEETAAREGEGIHGEEKGTSKVDEST